MEDGIRKSRILKRRAPYLPTAVPRQALAVRAVRAQTRPAAVRSAVHSRHTESPACPALYRLWTTGLLWKTGLLEAITPCDHERAFHINRPPLHRPFERASGRRGKLGHRCCPPRQVFQKCRITQLGFEKLACLSTPCLVVVSHVFPLFLRELRVLLSFLLISHPFPRNPSHCAAIELKTRCSPFTRSR